MAIPRLNAARVTSRLVRSTNLLECRDVAFSRANVMQPVERGQRTRVEPQREVIRQFTCRGENRVWPRAARHTVPRMGAVWAVTGMSSRGMLLVGKHAR